MAGLLSSSRARRARLYAADWFEDKATEARRRRAIQRAAFFAEARSASAERTGAAPPGASAQPGALAKPSTQPGEWKASSADEQAERDLREEERQVQPGSPSYLGGPQGSGKPAAPEPEQRRPTRSSMAKQGQHTGVAPPGLEAQPSATAELRGRVRAGRSSDLGSPGKPTATPPSQGQRQRADVRPREQAPGEVHATKRGRSVDPAPASQMQEGTRKPAGARHASGARAQTRPQAAEGQHTRAARPQVGVSQVTPTKTSGRVRAGRSSDLGSPGKPTATPPSQGQRQRADVRPREQAPGEVHATKRGRSVDPAPASQMQEGTRKPAGARHASGARAQTRPQAAEGQHTRAARPQVGVSQMTPTKTSGRVRAKGSPGKPTAAALGVLSANPEQQQGAAHPREWASSEGPTDLRTSRPVQPGTAAEQQQGQGKPKPGSQPQHPDGHSEDGPDRPEHPAGRKHPEWLGTRRMEQDHGHKCFYPRQWE